jgi:hypothetical protein
MNAGFNHSFTPQPAALLINKHLVKQYDDKTISEHTLVAQMDIAVCFSHYQQFDIAGQFANG